MMSSAVPPQREATTEFAGARATVAPSRDSLTLTIERDGGPAMRIGLGLTVDGAAFGPGSALVGAAERDVTEAFTMLTGKAAGPRRATHRELRVDLRDGGTGRDWAVLVRLARDGAAFRYELPGDAPAMRLGPERTALDLRGEDRLWTLEYTTWYENPRFTSTFAELAPGDYGFPTLIERDGHWTLLSESDIDGRSSGAHLRVDADGARVAAADEETAVAGGHRTPWRVAIAGDLATIVASQLVDELAPPADDRDYAFVRPGRGAWSWWSSQYSGAYLDDQKRFCDFAAAQGWEHVLVDCGWDAAWVPELVGYASARGVQVHLWSAWDDLDGEERLRKLGQWAAWGVAGIKVDFMESESQERYRWYDAIIAEAARVGLMVNFHGSVIPRGWARTHPHIVSYEGIRGAEYYVFYGSPLTAAHNVAQPFTRNVVGSMDYTPVAFSAPERETSDGHELALGVVYESGITHFADDPAEYERRPAARTLLAQLAPRWDEVRLLGGHPDREAVLARRAGDRWFVGAIAAGEAREITVDLGSLVDGERHAWFVHDRDGALAERTTGERTLTLPVAEHGGFAGIVAPAGTPLLRPVGREPAALPAVTPPVASIRPGGSVDLDVPDGAEVVAEPGWRATRADGRWRIEAPADARPGSAGVVSVREGADPDRIAHARLFVALDGEHALSDLAFLTARNAVGPVERDCSNGGGDPRDGTTPTVGGCAFAKAIGVSHDSLVEFRLSGGPQRLTGGVGIDDETPGAAATATVAVDGETRLRFDLAPGEFHEFDLDLQGASTLALATEPVEGAPLAHLDWTGSIAAAPRHRDDPLSDSSASAR